LIVTSLVKEAFTMQMVVFN